MGHHVVVGRKTFESIGRALPGRRMVVISRGEPDLPPGVSAAASLDDALDQALRSADDEAFVAGGEEIYRLALPLADRLYLTRVHASPPGDAHFPPFEPGDWWLVEREEGIIDARSPLPHTFLVYDRGPAVPPAS
jgi:dihydrofolate reductase